MEERRTSVINIFFFFLQRSLVSYFYFFIFQEQFIVFSQAIVFHSVHHRLRRPFSKNKHAYKQRLL